MENDVDGIAEEQDEERHVLRAEVFCERLRYIGALAFVETLMRKSWPLEWEIGIRHRVVHPSENAVEDASSNGKKRSAITNG